MLKSIGRAFSLGFALFAATAVLGSMGLSGQVLAVGGQVSMNRDLTKENTWGFGGRAMVSLPLSGITVQGTADFFNPDCDPLDCDFREISLNLLWSIPVPWLANPYFGAGVAAQTSKGDWEFGDAEDYGVNLVAGIVLQGPTFDRFQPFGEVKYQVMDDFDGQMVFSFGILLNLI